jgi:hypothetical protein
MKDHPLESPSGAAPVRAATVSYPSWLKRTIELNFCKQRCRRSKRGIGMRSRAGWI